MLHCLGPSELQFSMQVLLLRLKTWYRLFGKLQVHYRTTLWHRHMRTITAKLAQVGTHNQLIMTFSRVT